MNTIYIILEILQRTYIKLFNGKISLDGQIKENLKFSHHIYNEQQEIIKNLIQKEGALFAGRLGSIELDCFNNFQQHQNLLKGNDTYSSVKYIQDKVYPKWISIRTKNGMQNNAGFFPATEKNIIKYGQLINQCLQNLDILLSWQRNEKYLPLSNQIPKIIMYNISYPFLFTNPWTSALKDKKVLVISPFSKTIQYQYSRRELLFKNPNVLPEFTLITLQSYNILRGKNNTNINDWFEALNKMEQQINNIDFDIALIGCGAYAFPLAAYCKTLGKKAITVCGAIQLLFGIYGNRWEDWLKQNNILNQNWTRPLDSKPIGFEKVEKGAYW